MQCTPAAGGAFPGSKKVNEDAPVHDGDVLSDSLNISESYLCTADPQTVTVKDESSLVTSDDVSELNTDTYFQELSQSGIWTATR
ncbi:MAG: hypothetical protein V8Q42_03950 [Anaerovoracaceae bacterium]